jgi:hypothetical protein
MLEPIEVARSFTCSTTRLMTLRVAGAALRAAAAAAAPAAAPAAAATAVRLIFVRFALRAVERFFELDAPRFRPRLFALFLLDERLFEDRFFDDFFDELRPRFFDDLFFEDLEELFFLAAMYCLLLKVSVGESRTWIRDHAARNVWCTRCTAQQCRRTCRDCHA